MHVFVRWLQRSTHSVLMGDLMYWGGARVSAYVCVCICLSIGCRSTRGAAARLRADAHTSLTDHNRQLQTTAADCLPLPPTCIVS